MTSTSPVATAIMAFLCVTNVFSLKVFDGQKTSTECGSWCEGNSRPWSMKCEWNTCSTCTSCTSAPEEVEEETCTSYPGEAEIHGEDLATEAFKKHFSDLQKQLLPHRFAHAMKLACLEGSFEVNPELPDAFQKGIGGSVQNYSALGRISETSPGLGHVLSFSAKLFDVNGAYVSQDFIVNPFQFFNFGLAQWGTEVNVQHLTVAPPFADVVSFAQFQIGFQHMEPDVPDPGPMEGMLQTDANVTPRNLFETSASDDLGFSFDGHGGHPINWADGNLTRGLRFWIDGPLLKSSCFHDTSPSNWKTCLDTTIVEEAVKQTMIDNGDELVVSLWGQLQGCNDEIEKNAVPWNSHGIAELGKFKFRSVIDSSVCNLGSFTPWNHHPDHKPLSSIGRARKPVYGTNQQLRRDANANLMTKLTMP